VTLNDLVQSATAVLIAKVDPLAPKAEPQDAEIDAPRIDLAKNRYIVYPRHDGGSAKSGGRSAFSRYVWRDR